MQTPWHEELEAILAGAIGMVALLILFDLANINPAHHSGKMLRLSIKTVEIWVTR